jgi:hypothetical protein
MLDEWSYVLFKPVAQLEQQANWSSRSTEAAGQLKQQVN